MICNRRREAADAIRAGCAEAKWNKNGKIELNDDAIRAGCAEAKDWWLWVSRNKISDAIRAGCAEAKVMRKQLKLVTRDAIRAGCSETNGRSLYSNDHEQNNEVKESYLIQPSNQIALFL